MTGVAIEATAKPHGHGFVAMPPTESLSQALVE
jgi:hypothetical protein